MLKNERKVESEQSLSRDIPRTEKVETSQTDGLPKEQGHERVIETDQADGGDKKI